MAHPGSQGDTNPSLSIIRHLNARFIIYTNGLVTSGALSGGAGMVVTEGDLANPTNEATVRSSYYLIIRRGESGHAHGARAALTIARSRDQVH